MKLVNESLDELPTRHRAICRPTPTAVGGAPRGRAGFSPPPEDADRIELPPGSPRNCAPPTRACWPSRCRAPERRLTRPATALASSRADGLGAVSAHRRLGNCTARRHGTAAGDAAAVSLARGRATRRTAGFATRSKFGAESGSAPGGMAVERLAPLAREARSVGYSLVGAGCAG